MNIRLESLRIGAAAAPFRQLRCILAAVMLCYLSACGPPQPETKEWTEDVQLSPGHVIQVQRTVVFDESDALGGGAYNAVEREAIISFTGDLAHLPTWRQPLIALVLYQDRATQEWVIVATSTSCDIWRAHGEPNPAYWEFRVRDGRWVELPLSDASIGRGKNLFHRYTKKFGSHITIDERLQREAGMNRRFSEVSKKEEQVYCESFAR